MRRHLLLPLHGEAVASIESWRRMWDPVMANVVPAHVTLVYPEETLDEGLLLDRAGTECGVVSEFRVRLGPIFVDDDGRGGVFITADDIDGGWRGLRRALLRPPMTPIECRAHVTLVHPRTSSRGPECYAAVRDAHLDTDVWVRDVIFTETTATTHRILRRFPLAATTI